MYTKWEEEKTKMSEAGDKIKIDGFINFHTNLINIEGQAKYVRKQSKSDDRTKHLEGEIESIFSTPRV